MANRFVEKLRNFGRLSPDAETALLDETSRTRQVGPRQDLIREGDRPGPVFIVLEGWACRYKILPNGTRQALAFLMPGDCCDLHVGLLAEMDHGIQTVTTATISTIERERMAAMMDQFPAIAKAMYVSQLVDEGTMRAWITSMGRRTSNERVAHLLSELYVRARNIGLTTEPNFAFPLSQLLLADALGMTAVHLNRVLKELRENDAVLVERNRLVVINAVKLAQIAGFDENYLHRRIRQAA